MKVLLDTHAWLWMLTEPERFSQTARSLVESPTTERLLSATSVWEIAIKYALGRLPLPVKPVDYVPIRLESTRTAPLDISITHALRAGELPPHHRDPFDRLIIAQGQLEDVPVLTADPRFRPYDVEVIDA